MYSWSLNNMSLNCVVLFIGRFFFSVTNTTVLHYHQLFESADVERYIWRDSQKLQAAVQLSTVTLFYAVTHP